MIWEVYKMETEQAILAADENCSGCLRCVLACSFFNTPERVFNPSKAHIRIEQTERQNKFKVVFKDSCLECGLCADYCNYGVLSMQ